MDDEARLVRCRTRIATTSPKHAAHFKRRARADTVMGDLPTAGVDYHAPFGGGKDLS